MTNVHLGDQYDESKATLDIKTTGDSKTNLSIGNQYDRSERKVKIKDTAISGLPLRDRETRRERTQRTSLILAFSFGIAMIIAILVLVVVIRDPTKTQRQVFSVVLALGAGGFATALSGMLKVKLTASRRVAIGATGALAVFIIVYFFVPALAG